METHLIPLPCLEKDGNNGCFDWIQFLLQISFGSKESSRTWDILDVGCHSLISQDMMKTILKWSYPLHIFSSSIVCSNDWSCSSLPSSDDHGSDDVIRDHSGYSMDHTRCNNTSLQWENNNISTLKPFLCHTRLYSLLFN